MIRIVHVISDLDAGGAEAMLVKVIRGMDRHRFFNAVISLTDRGQLALEIETSGVEVHTLGMKRGRPDVFAIPRLVKILKQLKPVIVQSWLYHADFLSSFAIRFAGSPSLIWNVRCSEVDLTQYSPITRWIQRMLAWRSDMPTAVIVNSQAGKVQHERLGYHPRRWEIIPNGFDTQQFRPDLGFRLSRRKEWQIGDDAVVVGLIARVDPMKDHTTFLAAAQQVSEARRNIYFILIGKDTEKLSNAVSDRGLDARVRLLGYRNDVKDLLPGLDIVCLSSAFGEGFPNVLGEAMACAIPCVSTDVGDARSILGDTGIIVPARDPRALSNAVIHLIDQGPLERATLGRAARKRIESRYGLSKVIERYMDLYASLASEKHRFVRRDRLSDGGRDNFLS
jgi:glycosyltransferase involved in cell wall biosynthesis